MRDGAVNVFEVGQEQLHPLGTQRVSLDTPTLRYAKAGSSLTADHPAYAQRHPDLLDRKPEEFSMALWGDLRSEGEILMGWPMVDVTPGQYFWLREDEAQPSLASVIEELQHEEEPMTEETGLPAGVQVTIVQDEDIPCPECGAYWGNPDPALDFPNRFKVADFCRCYNPGCPVAMYNPLTGEVEREVGRQVVFRATGRYSSWPMQLIELTKEQVDWLHNHLEEELEGLKEEADAEASDDLNDVTAGEVSLAEGIMAALEPGGP